MSHELRTPLHSILGCVEILTAHRGRLPEHNVDRYLERIRSSGDHLLAVIEDILDVSKLGAGYLPLEREVTPASFIVSTAVDMVTRAAEAKDLVNEQVSSGPAPLVTVDRIRAVQIVLNLLTNAVKFTPPRGRVRVSIVGAGSHVAFDVCDSGPGFPQSQSEEIFQPFKQLDGSLARKHEGAGLGLFLARQLALLHGGTLTARSEPGRGSTFTLTLPMHVPLESQQ